MLEVIQNYPRTELFSVDGETLLQEGKLVVLSDPKIRAIAAKYGDPDEILAQVPATLKDQFGG